MSYNNVPLSGESLGNTRIPINSNFSLIQTAISANHIAIGAAGAGKHTFLQMPEQTTLLDTAVNELGLYAKQGSDPAEANLFFRAEDSGGGGGKEYQLTTASDTNKATFGVNTNYTLNAIAYTGGWTFLPGGLILQWGVHQNQTNATLVRCQYQHTFQTILTQWFSPLRDASTVNNPQSLFIQENTLSTSEFSVRRVGASQNYKILFYGLGIGFA